MNPNPGVQKLKEEITQLKAELNQYREKEAAYKKDRKTLLNLGSLFFLSQAIKRLVNEWPNKVSKDTTADVGIGLIRRLTWVGLPALIFALIPIWLLHRQNTLVNNQNLLFSKQNERIDEQTMLMREQRDLMIKQDVKFALQNIKIDTQTRLFSRQNSLFDDQNRKIDIQTGLFRNQNELFTRQNGKIDTQNIRINLQNNLIEADRRSSLVFLMSNVLDKVDEEIREQKKALGITTVDVPDSIKFALSKPLVNRVVGLSRAFQPYRRLNADTLASELASPERGQLFIALMESQLDSLTQITIAQRGEFSNAIIGEVKMDSANLIGANLWAANLRAADLREANLIEAKLRAAKLIGANLRGADLREAYLWGTDLRGTDQRESFNTGITLNTIDQQIVLEPLNYAALFNSRSNPTWDITFFIDHTHHTTINDQETGLVPSETSIEVE